MVHSIPDILTNAIWGILGAAGLTAGWKVSTEEGYILALVGAILLVVVAIRSLTSVSFILSNR